MMRKAAALLFLSGILWGANPPAVPVVLTNPITDPTGATTYTAKTPTIAAAAIYVIPIIATTSYQAQQSDTLILAGNSTGTQVTITLPTTANLGQNLEVIKVDTSSVAVRVNGFGSDLIGSTTGTIYITAPNAHMYLVSDGVSWRPLSELPAPQAWIGERIDSGGSGGATANQAIFIATIVYRPITVYGLKFHQAAGGAGNADAGIFDANGTNNGPGKKLASSGSTPNKGANALNTYPFTSQVNLLPGLYWLALAWDSATPTVTKFTTNNIEGVASQTTAFPLPATAAATLDVGNAWALVGLVRNGVP